MSNATVGMPHPRRHAETDWRMPDREYDWDHQFALAVLYDDDSDPDDPRIEQLEDLAAR